ncbi:MAG TPA: hypothetical protein VLQ79_07495, partial [Myxococcaceae bacterium]|nr:hypothetical protein [Myxococcaceae bacterium]
ALYLVLEALGVHPVHAGTLLNWVALGLLAWTALLLLQAWDVPAAPVAVLCAAVAFVHPGLAEIFTFRFVPVFFATAMVLGIGGLARARAGAPVTGAVLMLASLTVYQVSLSTLLTAVALGVALGCVRDDLPVRTVLRGWARPAVAVGAAAVGALFLQRVLQGVLGPSLQGARGQFLSPGAVPARVQALGLVFRRVLGDERVLSTPALYVLQLAILALALGAAVVTRVRRNRAPAAAGVVASVALGLGAVVGLAALLASFYPAPRILSAAGPFWAGVLLVMSGTAGRRWPAIPVASAGLLLLAYAGIDHRVASDQVRLNTAELALASRVVGRLESLPGWPGVERVAIVGRSRAVPGIPQEFDVNPSALSVPWSRVMLLRAVSDRRFQEASASELARAEQRCASVEPWPAADSVAIDGSLAIVCLR